MQETGKDKVERGSKRVRTSEGSAVDLGFQWLLKKKSLKWNEYEQHFKPESFQVPATLLFIVCHTSVLVFNSLMSDG